MSQNNNVAQWAYNTWKVECKARGNNKIGVYLHGVWIDHAAIGYVKNGAPEAFFPAILRWLYDGNYSTRAARKV